MMQTNRDVEFITLIYEAKSKIIRTFIIIFISLATLSCELAFYNVELLRLYYLRFIVSALFFLSITD